MRYTVNANTFMQLPYTTGTVQNISNTDIEISNEQVIGTGIILKAGETFAFDNATIYACARPVLDGGTGIISVVPFNAGGRGGESPIYVPKGSIAFSALPTTLNSTMLGWTYNVSDAFTTDSRFVEGSGIDYPAGENVVVVEPSTGVFKYDCFGGAYILPTASTTVKGGVKISDSFGVTNDVLNLNIGTTTIVGGVKSDTTEGKVTVNNDGTMTYNPLGYRQPDTIYTVGNIAYHNALSMQKLVCVKAGTTASGDITPSTTEGALVTDGTVTWQVDSLADGNYTAIHQNGIAGGRDITAYWESGIMSTNIQAGKFVGMHIGDFITKSVTLPAITYTDKAGTEQTQAAQTFTNVKWYVAAIDPHIHCGDTETTAHHVLLIPASTLQRNVKMNPTDDTTGAYTGSDMWRVHIPNWASAIKTAFGSGHVLKHRELLANAINATAASGAGAGWVGTASSWAWTDVEVNIPNEQMIYGGRVWGSGFDGGDFPRILPLYALKCSHLDDRSWFWLRAVASASDFADANDGGGAGCNGASNSNSYGGVRPYFLAH